MNLEKVDSLEEAKYRGLITDYLKRGEKINAIKVYRTNTSSSLKEAKDYVDAFTRGLDKRGNSTKVMPRIRRTLCIKVKRV